MNKRQTDIKCPCCENRITVVWLPGTPGDRTHPGDPPEITYIEGCECQQYIDHLYTKVPLTGPEGTRGISYQGALEDYDSEVWERIGDFNDRLW